MIIGALLSQQERDRRLSFHCRSPQADLPCLNMDELLGISRPEPINSSKINEEMDEYTPKKVKKPEVQIDYEKIIQILTKTKAQRHFQELFYLFQELEKIEYFFLLRQRCKDKRYRDAISSLSYRFVKKGDFIVKKNDIGTCLVLDDDETYNPNRPSQTELNTQIQSPKNQSAPAQRSSQVSNTGIIGFSNFRQALQSWYLIIQTYLCITQYLLNIIWCEKQNQKIDLKF